MKTTTTADSGNSALTASGAAAAINSSTTFVHSTANGGPDPHTQARVNIGGTFTGATTKIDGLSPSGTLWIPLLLVSNAGVRSVGSDTPADSTNTSWVVDIRGFSKIRVYNSAGTITSMSVEVTSGTQDEFGSALSELSTVSVATVSAGLTFSGGSGSNTVTIPDNLASAWSLVEASNKYVELITTNSSEAVKLHKNVTLLDGITIANSANTTGTSLWGASDKGGFFGATPVVQRSAYTQTFSTADRTISNATAATLTVTDGAGTNDNTIGAITADASVIAAVQEIVDEINKLIADVADTKQAVNAIIDDFQALGICA